MSLQLVSAPQHNIECGIMDTSWIRDGECTVRIVKSSDLSLLNRRLRIPKEELSEFTAYPPFKVGDVVVRSAFPARPLNDLFPKLRKGIITDISYVSGINYLYIKITESDEPRHVGQSLDGIAWWCFEHENPHHPEFVASAPVWSMFEG